MIDVIVLFGWTFIIGVFVLGVYLTAEDDFKNSKAYKDLNETILNRNENV